MYLLFTLLQLIKEEQNMHYMNRWTELSTEALLTSEYKITLH